MSIRAETLAGAPDVFFESDFSGDTGYSLPEGAGFYTPFTIRLSDCITLYTTRLSIEIMAAKNILTVRMKEDELARLDELANLQNRSRSQLVQDAVREMIDSSDELRQLEFQRLKTRLAAAVEEQCALLETNSVADEHRRF